MRSLLLGLISGLAVGLLMAASLYPADDPLERTIAAGETLIVALPDAVDGTAVESYRIAEAPALSGLADRSFFWRTQAEDTGTHRILFHAERSDAPADTLALHVTVE